MLAFGALCLVRCPIRPGCAEVWYGTVWIKGGSTQDVQLLRARMSNKEIESLNKRIRLTEKARMAFDSLAKLRCAGKYVDKDKELQQPSSG